ncbi:MAG: efflux RND transporter permease subunit [Planctomycetes bacterium]|nr:efflux RND transporter permease subunit [Planctomycetota bacterium]
MNLIAFALRRPITVMVVLIGLALTSVLAVRRMAVDIFPALNLPVVYVCQPYGGMDPAQMEGLLTNYYEYHFLYINGIHHVESRNVQGMALMKLVFHPGTNMAQAMAETIGYVNRSRAFMPPGTVPPFVMRFDTGSVPVGYLVLSSDTVPIAEIQDKGLFTVRPMFAALPGVSAPPPFGGSARAIVINLDPDRLRAYQLSPENVVAALADGNTIAPSGNIHLDDRYPIVPLNSILRDPQDMRNIPLRKGAGPPVYVGDVAFSIEDSTDLPTGYALINGRRAVYILVTKRADASTLSVVSEVRKALPRMQTALPEGINVSFEFDQSPYVTRSIQGLLTEGGLGALLTGLMVLIFLRDWRSALVVVLNIPLALMAAVLGLWITGQTINLMTLGGLTLAIGILVDEATVEIENIHTQFAHSPTIAHAVRRGNAQTAIPRLLSMLCILAVFLPAVFMEGAARGLFMPLAMAVAFAMIASYILSSTFVPVVSTWLLCHVAHHEDDPSQQSWFDRQRARFERWESRLIGIRGLLVPAYLTASIAVVYFLGTQLGMEIFPTVDTGQFRLRLRAPDGTHFDRTEQVALAAINEVKQLAGPDNVELTLGYVGSIPSSYPINAVYQWSRGPEESLLRVALRPKSGVRVEKLKQQLRERLSEKMPDVRASFEPGDIINEVMSFGSPTPIEVAVIGGKNAADVRAYVERIRTNMTKIDAICDLQYAQSLEYPTVTVDFDRRKGGLSNVTAADVARSLIPATSSSRFTMPNYWPDPKTGVGYQVQVQVPQRVVTVASDLEAIPVKDTPAGQVLLRDVASVARGTMPGQFDRYNNKREIGLTANIRGSDLYHVSRQLRDAIADAGKIPDGAVLDIRGQIPPMEQLLTGLGVGLGVAVLVVLLLLAANYQSWRLALATVSTAPAAIAGAVAMLWLTHTTLNLQSFIGAIMALGVSMANAILLVSFAEHIRRDGATARDAAAQGAASRLRPILMTTCAMLAGMLPMALGLGEGGEQFAPLGRSVIGGLLGATTATLLVLPSVFAIAQRNAPNRSASLDPDDPQSIYHQVAAH